jgi:hypothetical protein
MTWKEVISRDPELMEEDVIRQDPNLDLQVVQVAEGDGDESETKRGDPHPGDDRVRVYKDWKDESARWFAMVSFQTMG